MPNEVDDGRSAPRDVSRRHLFKQVGLAGAAQGAAPATSGAVPKPEAAPAPQAAPPAAPRLEALETLTAAEADTLEAIVARLPRARTRALGSLQRRG